jgi:hypothetical protein
MSSSQTINFQSNKVMIEVIKYDGEGEETIKKHIVDSRHDVPRELLRDCSYYEVYNMVFDPINGWEESNHITVFPVATAPHRDYIAEEIYQAAVVGELYVDVPAKVVDGNGYLMSFPFKEGDIIERVWDDRLIRQIWKQMRREALSQQESRPGQLASAKKAA